MKQYEEKYDFINKALLESITHITEMTKTDHHSVRQGEISRQNGPVATII